MKDFQTKEIKNKVWQNLKEKKKRGSIWIVNKTLCYTCIVNLDPCICNIFESIKSNLFLQNWTSTKFFLYPENPITR